MFDEGMHVISKTTRGWRVHTREGVWDMEPHSSTVKTTTPPVSAPDPVPVPVKKTVADDRNLVRLVEEVVAAALDEVVTADSGATQLRQDVAGMNNSLDAAAETLNALQQDDDQLRERAVELIDEAAAIMKFTGISATGTAPLNVNDALAASLARRRGR